MVFSSFVFLLVFLPITILGYYLMHPKIKNVFLLIASLLFYSWGDLYSIPILIGSIVLNYLFALIIGKSKKETLSKAIVIIMLIFNIALLFIFKYLSYTLQTMMKIIPQIQIDTPKWGLPLGISFYTFSAISYVLDVYFQSTHADRNILNVSLYMTFFPKMISGPIMKWSDFQQQLNNRQIDINLITDGIKRFIIGLGKKVIISDTIGFVADHAFRTSGFDNLSVVFAWYGVIAYIIQLYFDFSGYSDMAIGLGKMFGFSIDENFDYPFTAKNITNYWSKWHITLGTWVKHYIYTPVFRGLSKYKNKKTGKKINMHICDYIALLVSWLIIGPWHGAGPKFIVYGLYYCLFIILERLFENYKKKRKKAGKPIKTNFFTERILPHIYFAVVIIFGQMIFRADSLVASWSYFLAMFGGAGNAFITTIDGLYMLDSLVVLMIGLFLSLPLMKKLFLLIRSKSQLAYSIITMVLCVGILILSIAAISITSYNAFIYFNF